MEIFAAHYLSCNPGGVLDNTDTAYILSYSIIMLHTSLHNPSVKDKPDVARFVSMNRGINNGGDLPKDFLSVTVWEELEGVMAVGWLWEELEGAHGGYVCGRN